jgi:hypothetical protein
VMDRCARFVSGLGRLENVAFGVSRILTVVNSVL